MTRPLIAIGARRLRPGRVVRWPDAAVAAPHAYADALTRAGGRPTLLVPEPLDDLEARRLLERFDALVLTGGGDIDPARYEEAPGDHVYGIDQERDAFEIALARAAVESEIPMLAICRGVQVLNVALGGTLEQHLPSVPDLLSHGDPGVGEHVEHDVRLEPGSRVAEAMGVDRASCLSHHHQAVAKIGGELVATAWASDGVVEALEHERGWVVGVQWHPEVTAATDAAQQRLFEAVVRRAAR